MNGQQMCLREYGTNASSTSAPCLGVVQSELSSGVYRLTSTPFKRDLVRVQSGQAAASSEVASPPSLAAYMQQIETWAEAYDREPSPMTAEELEALYDEACSPVG